MENQQRAQNQTNQLARKYKITDKCPHHLIILEIPDEMDGTANALTAGPANTNSGALSLTAKSLSDT